jgi:hypothetical protein
MPGEAPPRMALAVVRRVSIPRGVSLVALALAVAGCAATPLPAARPLRDQSARDLAWDSRTCAWAAQDASGYDRELSPGENGVVNVFVHGRAGGPAARDGDAVGAAALENIAATVDASAAGRPALGQGGRKRFDQVYEQCMTRRGYELSRRSAEGEAK